MEFQDSQLCAQSRWHYCAHVCAFVALVSVGTAMRRKFVQIDGELVEVDNAYRPVDGHHVMPDFQPFVANDGTVIKGRRQWREHLKNTGGLEMGHADIKRQTEVFRSKQEAHRAKLAKHADTVKDATSVVAQNFDPTPRSRLSAEVANRLHGKTPPSRRELVNLAVELKRREQR